MRGANYQTVLPKMDQVERIYNIFHPYDPVAYRLEPLFHENYRYIRPVKLFGYTEGISHAYDSLVFECHKSFLKRKKKDKEVDKSGRTDAKEKGSMDGLEKVFESGLDKIGDDSDSGDGATACKLCN